MRRIRGFTLIELLIVVVVLGSLSSIAIAAYETYVEESQSLVVSGNYRAAVRDVRTRYIRAANAVDMGIAPAVAAPDDAAGWIALLNPKGERAPTLAGAAYIEGPGDAALGSIGIDVTGSFGDGDLVVTVSLPSFGKLPPDSTAVAQSDI